jgi:hypothetical protein
MADRVADVADRLYGLPLEEFTRERDAAAKALRREKERDAAAEVGRLPKPSAGGWAVNVLAREQPELRDELLAAGDAVREVQESALAGTADRADMRAATARQRAAVDALLDAAAGLRPGGKALSSAALDKLRQTLQAAAGDEGIRQAIAAGRLVREADGAGAWPFDAPPPAPPPPPRAPRAGGRRAGRDAARSRRAEREAAERETAQREAAERRRELETRLGEARAERRARERELTRAEREAERARARFEQAEAALEEARTHVEEAGAELTAARREVEQARDHAARLEEQLG